MFSRDQYDALRHGAGIVGRDDRRLIALTGADRLTYLQGLLTNDVAALAPGTGCYAALLTAQGRMIADMRVLERGDRVLIDVHESIASTVRDKLEQFIFSEDAQVGDLTEQMRVVGIYGPAAAGVVEQVVGGHQVGAMRLFANRELTTAAGPITIVRSDDVGVEGFDLLADAQAASSMAAAFAQAGAVHVARDATEVTRVEAGRPAWSQDMDDTTIPLEAGIEERAISLTKGCYVGQEIIIRVLHRGHGRVAKRLVGLRLATDASIPTAGDRIRSGGREIGVVTSAVFSPRAQSPLALGYVHRDYVEPSTQVIIVHDGHGADATVVSLPL